MPNANGQQLIQVFQEFVSIADDVSAIPKYVGGQAGGGAGRTASGLAMLMGNASKILQTVSANIDRDVLEGLLLQLFDLLMLTDTSGMLTGEEQVSVTGVSVAIQRETLRQRQIEFLTATNNPTDMHIMGLKGRAKVLDAVSQTIGMPGADLVPSDDKLEMMEKQQQQQQASGGIEQMINKKIDEGVAAGMKRIATDLAAGALAQKMGVPEGPPVHEGTLGGQPGMNSEETDLGHPNNQPVAGNAGSQNGAAQAQGNQPPAPSRSMGPQTHLVGSGQPRPGGRTTGGVG
jgi:hypothetical protein